MAINTVSRDVSLYRPTQMAADMGDSYVAVMSLHTWLEMTGHPLWRKPSPDIAKEDYWQQVKSDRGALKENLRWTVAAELERKLIKLDGHTRAVLWSKRKLPLPESVYVVVYRCTTRSELDALYARYHFTPADQPLHDQVLSAYTACGLDLKSPRLQSGMIGLALRIAAYGTSKYAKRKRPGQNSDEADPSDVVREVRMFAEELRQLDLIGPPIEMFQTGVVAAALLAIALDREYLQYFSLLAQRKDREIRRKNGLLDPVGGLLNMIGSLQKVRGSWHKEQQLQLCASALTGAFAWKEGESHPHYWVKEALPPADLQEIVRRVQDLKKSGGHPGQ